MKAGSQAAMAQKCVEKIAGAHEVRRYTGELTEREFELLKSEQTQRFARYLQEKGLCDVRALAAAPAAEQLSEEEFERRKEQQLAKLRELGEKYAREKDSGARASDAVDSSQRRTA